MNVQLYCVLSNLRLGTIESRVTISSGERRWYASTALFVMRVQRPFKGDVKGLCMNPGSRPDRNASSGTFDLVQFVQGATDNQITQFCRLIGDASLKTELEQLTLLRRSKPTTAKPTEAKPKSHPNRRDGSEAQLLN